MQDSLIQKDRICYKYLDDMTQSLVDPNHVWSKDTIQYLGSFKYGGEMLLNLWCGPMYRGRGKGGKKDPRDAKIKLWRSITDNIAVACLEVYSTKLG